MKGEEGRLFRVGPASSPLESSSLVLMTVVVCLGGETMFAREGSEGKQPMMCRSGGRGILVPRPREFWDRTFPLRGSNGRAAVMGNEWAVVRGTAPTPDAGSLHCENCSVNSKTERYEKNPPIHLDHFAWESRLNTGFELSKNSVDWKCVRGDEGSSELTYLQTCLPGRRGRPERGVRQSLRRTWWCQRSVGLTSIIYLFICLSSIFVCLLRGQFPLSQTPNLGGHFPSHSPATSSLSCHVFPLPPSLSPGCGQPTQNSLGSLNAFLSFARYNLPPPLKFSHGSENWSHSFLKPSRRIL